MKFLFFVASLLLMIGSAEARTAAHARTRAAHALTTDSHRAIAIGPWQIEASFTKQRKFDRCAMSRTIEEGIETRLTRDKGGLSLTMSSPRWQLPRGKKYPVEFVAGPVSWDSKVSATNETINISLMDRDFNEALKSAEMLDFAGPAILNPPQALRAAWRERMAALAVAKPPLRGLRQGTAQWLRPDLRVWAKHLKAKGVLRHATVKQLITD